MQYKAIGPDKKTTSVKLLEMLDDGGEGCVYATDMPGCVAKVFKPGKATQNKYDKCSWFIDNKISYKGICLPTHLLADEDDNFIGYVMPRASGTKLASVIHPIELREKHPDLPRCNLVALCMSILEQVQFLHENNILVFDLDMSNIFVDKLETGYPETFIIDCDSFQIGTGDSIIFPGDVGRPLATPKELQGIPFKDQARTFANEYFSVTVLLFEILIPNQNPYMRRGGENDEVQLVKHGQFPYTAVPEKIQRVADEIPGQWVVDIWESLPPDITALFWSNLHKEGKNYAPENRTSVEEWSDTLWLYHVDLAFYSESPRDVLVFPKTELQKAENTKIEEDTIYAKLQIEEKSKVFKSVSHRLEPDGSPAAFFVFLGLGILLYVLDPLAIITATSIQALPDLIVDNFGWFFILFAFILSIGVSFTAGTVFAKIRESHYWGLAKRGEAHDVFENGEVIKPYKLPLASVDTLMNKEKKYRNYSGAVAAVILTVLLYAVIGLVTSNDGWQAYADPNVETTYIENKYAVLNSATEGAFGDETDFVQAACGNYVKRGDTKPADYDWHGDVIEVVPNEPFIIRVLARNDNVDPQAEAKDVKVVRHVKMENNNADMLVTYVISYDDGSGERKYISDDVRIHFNSTFNLRRYPCYGAYLRPGNFGLGEVLLDSNLLISEEGAQMGTVGYDTIPGGEDGYFVLYESDRETTKPERLFSDGWSEYGHIWFTERLRTEGDQPLINALSTAAYGDESDFVRAARTDYANGSDGVSAEAWKGDVLELNPDDPYVVKVLVRNDNEVSWATAYKVRLKRNAVWTSDQDLKITYTITYAYSTGEEFTLSDDVTLHYTEPVDPKSLVYKSALRSKNLGDGDAVFTKDTFATIKSDEGLLVGIDGFTGKIPGGDDGYCLLYEYSVNVETE